MSIFIVIFGKVLFFIGKFSDYCFDAVRKVKYD